MAQVTHHSGLKDAGVRDFLAKQTRPNNVIFSDSPDLQDHMVKMVRKAQADLDAYYTSQALCRMFKEFGWEAYDVSDHVKYDERTYIPFVGTKDELKEVYPDAEGLI